ncbi:MAG: hypothetical protein WC321_06055 [Candidatus Omnitrophota bacterium]|jgi:hypothetical protein
MKKSLFTLLIVSSLFVSFGCVPLIIGGAAGALGAKALSKDTIQGETDISYDSLWNAALRVSRIRGVIKQEDGLRGDIELQVGASKAYIRLIRLTHVTTRIRISARKYHLPDIELAQDLFVKIMEEAK